MPKRSNYACRSDGEAYSTDPGIFESRAMLWGVTFVIFVLLYVATRQQGVDWGDSGMYALRVFESDIRGGSDLTRAHPLYIVLAQLVVWIPIGDFAGRVSFFSGLGMAIALANLAVLSATISGNRLAGFLLAAMLGTAQTPWLLAAIPEVYTWVVAGLSAELLLLWKLLDQPNRNNVLALAFVSGLGFSLHNLALLALPIYLLIVLVLIYRRDISPLVLLFAAGSWLLGAGLYLWLIGERAVESGSVIIAIGDALVGPWKDDVLSGSLNWKYLKWNLPFLALNFVSVLGPLVVVGALSLRRVGYIRGLAIVGITVVHVLFVIRYRRPDMFTFALPSLVMLLVIASIGAARLLESVRWRNLVIVGLALSLIIQPVVYAAGPWLVAAAGVNTKRARTLPFRNDLSYWLVPWKHNEHSAQLFVESAFAQVAPNGVIVADVTPRRPLQFYAATNAELAGVTLIDKNDEELPVLLESLRDRPIFIVAPAPSYTPQWLLDSADFTPEGVLFRIKFRDRK